MKRFSDRLLPLVGFALFWAMPATARAQEKGSERILKSNDEILITVFGEEELTTESQISKSGAVEFPLIGTVQLAGKTVQVAVAEISERLENFVRDPKVTLTVTGRAVENALVLGHVRHPGPIELPEDTEMDLLAVVAMAGGFSEYANPSQVVVRRKVEGEDKVFRLDARKLAGDETAKPFVIQPSDVISIAEQIVEQITVMGHVKTPGMVEIPADGDLDILSAIALAGGFSETADSSRVIVRRRSGGANSVRRIDAEKLINDPSADSFFVEPRDVITVGVLLPQSVTVMGEVEKPGVIEIPPGEDFDLLDAIASAGGYTDVANPKKITVRRSTGGEEKLYQINGKRLAGDPEARPFYVHPNDVITIAESFF